MGILCAVMGMVLKSVKGEFALFVWLVGTVGILLLVIPPLGEVMSETASLFAGSEINRYAEVMLRAVGVALLTRICSDVCRDTGAPSVANGVELAGKLVILTLCLPMIREIIGYASRILQETEI